MTDLISQRALNRAALARQLLLRREAMPVLAAVRHLVALNAQDRRPPYLTLWARLSGFTREELTDLLEGRSVVRSSLLRATQHMAAAEDYRWLRPLLQPVLVRAWKGAFSRYAEGMDLTALGAAAAEQLADGRVLTRPQLRDRLVARFPDREPQALGWSVQSLLPVVHPPPVGTWERGGATQFALAEQWLGRPMMAEPQPGELIRRYLAAFGPATVMDVQAWSGLTRLREVVERMAPRLRRFRSESGAELYDLPEAPLTDPETPAPVRLLPEFDNLILAYADRSRMMGDEQRRRVCVGAATAATVLVDGRVAGIWTLRQSGGTAILAVEPLARLSAVDRAAITDEAARLLTFAEPEAQHDIRYR